MNITMNKQNKTKRTHKNNAKIHWIENRRETNAHNKNYYEQIWANWNEAKLCMYAICCVGGGINDDVCVSVSFGLGLLKFFWIVWTHSIVIIFLRCVNHNELVAHVFTNLTIQMCPIVGNAMRCHGRLVFGLLPFRYDNSNDHWSHKILRLILIEMSVIVFSFFFCLFLVQLNLKMLQMTDVHWSVEKKIAAFVICDWIKKLKSANNKNKQRLKINTLQICFKLPIHRNHGGAFDTPKHTIVRFTCFSTLNTDCDFPLHTTYHMLIYYFIWSSGILVCIKWKNMKSI